MIALIDGDLSSFIPAASAENEEEGIAIARTANFVENILATVGTEAFEIYLSGKNNFRYQIFPEYKVGRIGAYRPKWEKQCRQYLLDEWGAKEIDGCEADDWLGVRQTELGDQSIICSIDKDMNMIPGWHYSWPIMRNGEVVREGNTYYVTPEEGLYHFYYQLLVGDSTDGIKGAKGIGPKKAVKILQGCKTESEYLGAVREYFSCDEELELNAKVLWIWRKQDGIWKAPNGGPPSSSD